MPQAIGLYLATAALQAGATVTAAAAISAVTSAVVTIGISLGLSYIGQLLVGKPQAPKPSDVKNNIREPVQPRFRSYGLVRAGGVILFIAKRQDRLFRIIAMGQGKIHAVLEHWLDDRKVEIDANGFVTSDVDGLNQANRVQIEFRLGTNNQTTYSSMTGYLPDVWSPQHQGNGFPHAAVILKHPGPEEFSKVFPNGVSTKYSQTQESSEVFDPRTSTTIYTENAALCIRDLLVSEYGFKLPAIAIAAADPDIITAANVSDQDVPLKGGGTEKRWRVGFSYTLNERPGDVLQRALDACDGMIFPTSEGGLTLKVGQWEEPTVTLNDDVILSVSGLTRGGSILTRFNTIRAQYTSRFHNFEEVDADAWVNEDLVSRFGEVSKDIQIYASPSHGQTRRLMKLIERRLNPRWRMTIVTNLAGLAVLGQRFINVQLADYGINESFEVQGQPQYVVDDENRLIAVQIELVSMSASAYAWNAELEEGTPPVLVGEIIDDDDLPVPTGFDATVSTRLVQGQTLTYVKLIANDPVREDQYLFFEVSSDGGGTWVEVPHEQPINNAEYGPLADTLTYQARASTINARKEKGDPTAVKTFSAVSTPPLTPELFIAALSSLTVDYSSRGAKNDRNTQSLQFRRGTTAQAFADAPIIDDQIGGAGDVRSGKDTPGYGTFRYWATAKNAAGVVAVTPAGPIDVTVKGPELVTNGGFDTDTLWVKGTGWTIGSGVATKAAGATAGLDHTLAGGALLPGTYELTWTIVTYTGGTFATRLLNAGGSAQNSALTRTAAGTYVDTFTVTLTDRTVVRIAATTTTAAGNVDNVSLKRIA